jgi:hypothetical protein
VQVGTDAPGAAPLPARGELTEADEAPADGPRDPGGWSHRLRKVALVFAGFFLVPVVSLAIVARWRRGRANPRASG